VSASVSEVTCALSHPTPPVLVQYACCCCCCCCCLRLTMKMWASRSGASQRTESCASHAQSGSDEKSK